MERSIEDQERLDANLREAAQSRSEVGVALWLGHGANPHARQGGVDRNAGRVALHIAAVRGSAECARLLLPVTDPSCVDDSERDALMLAAYVGSAECVALLLPVSDPLRHDKYGFTALMIAAQGGRADCARLLLPVSDLTAKDPGGRLASGFAEQYEHWELASELRSAEEACALRAELSGARVVKSGRGPGL